MNVLMAIQLLVEMVAPSNKQLLHHVYQFVLFDFRLWSRSEFTVRIGSLSFHLNKNGTEYTTFIVTRALSVIIFV